MNILVFSDSHGHPDHIKEALRRQIKRPDAVIFLGDGQRDMLYLELDGIPFYRVSGNCDLSSLFSEGNAPDEMTVELGGKRIFITHGHNYAVKSGYGVIIAAALKRDADIVLFGHTHECLEKCLSCGNDEYGIPMKKEMYLVNPGSIGYYPNSWACIEIDKSGGVLISHGALL